MTKFEEEVKRPVIGIGQSSIKPALGKAVEFYTDKVKKYHNAFSDMNKYIDHIEDKLDCANERIVLLEGTVDDLKSQLQQQALPVVPEVSEWVAECLETFIERNESVSDSLSGVFYERTSENNLSKFGKWMRENPVDFVRAMDNGYTVEKPQLFYIELPNVYVLSDSVFVSKVENGTILEFTKGKDYALAFTEQEIKSIDERYWQFAVPAEDEE